MSFVGVIAEHQKFENLKNIMQKNMNKNEITLININKKSIENLKNVKFDVIVAIDIIDEFYTENALLENVCKDAEYLIINADMKIKPGTLTDIKANIITFGHNHKSTITFSSITDEMILISVQRNFKSKNGNMIEMGEYNCKLSYKERTFLYEVLIRFIIKKLYNI